MVECTFAFVFEGLPETGKRYAVAVEDLTWEFSAFDWHEYDWDVRIFDLVVP